MGTATEPVDIAIIGGGIAGLVVADRLQQQSPRFRVALFEGSDRLGGKILSETVETDDGRFVIEGGPDAFLVQKPWAKALAEELGLGERLVPINSVPSPVSILKGGRPIPLPAGVSLLAPTQFGPFLRSPLMSTSGKARVMAELSIPARKMTGDESIAAFVSRRFGAEAVDWLAEPLLAGIYNAEPERMSLLATFPQFRTLEQQHGSLIGSLRSTALAAKGKPRGPAFMSFCNGMSELTDALARRVSSMTRMQTTVQRLRRAADGRYLLFCSDGSEIVAHRVIVTLPAIDAARLLESVAPLAANELARLRTVGAGSLSLAYRTEDIKRPLSGYGLVIPKRESRPINAITVASSKFAGRSPAGYSLLRIFFGGARSAETMFYNEDRLLSVVSEQLRDLMGIDGAPVLHRLYRWKTGSPQYDVGHLDRIAAAEAALPTGLVLAGGTYHGVGIPDIVRTATDIARKIADGIPDSPLVASPVGGERRESAAARKTVPPFIDTFPPLPSVEEGARG